MRDSRRPHPLHAFLTLTILLMFCTAAQAEDVATDEKTRELRSRDILLSELAELTVSKESLRSHFHVTKTHGVEYRKSILLGERKLHLKAYGPIWKKRPGLAVELRGIAIADHALTLRLYGNTKQQGLRIGLAF